MTKSFILCIVLVALAVAESKSIRQGEEPCHECFEKRAERAKRNAPAIINGVSNLVNGILDTNWKYIARINANKLRAQRRQGQRPLIIGAGNNRSNKLMLNSDGWGGWDIQY